MDYSLSRTRPEPDENGNVPEPEARKTLASGTRVTIELEGAHKRGKGSVDEYLEQTAIANPHVTIHYTDPDNNDGYTIAARPSCLLNPKKSNRIHTVLNLVGSLT